MPQGPFAYQTRLSPYCDHVGRVFVVFERLKCAHTVGLVVRPTTWGFEMEIVKIKERLGRAYDKAVYGVPAAVAVAVLSSPAAAAGPEIKKGDGVGSVAKTVNESLGGISELVMAGSFVAGLVLAAAGLMKLKQAADTQGQQVKYADGLWRLGIGVCLVALPAVIGSGLGTTGFTETGGKYVGKVGA